MAKIKSCRCVQGRVGVENNRSQSLGILLLYIVIKAGVVGIKRKGNVLMIMEHFIGIGGM